MNQVTSEGLPVLFITDLPPETIRRPTITEPSIYFGELSNDYVFVRTRAREFHYPRGDDNVYTHNGPRRRPGRVARAQDACSRCGSARTRSRSATTSP